MSNNRLMRFVNSSAGRPTLDVFQMELEPLRSLAGAELFGRNCYLRTGRP